MNPLYPHPPACALFMTSRCNLACAWCRRQSLGAPAAPDMTVEVVQALLAQYPGISAFAMAGQGEPTLARDFAAVVRYLNGLGKRLVLDTNGVNSRGFEGLRFDRISLSLYGHDRASFLAYAGVDAFAHVLRSWQIYRNIASERAITYIVDKTGLGRLAKILALCDELKPDVVLLYNPLCYDPADAAQRERVITSSDDIRAIRRLASGRAYPVRLPPFPAPGSSPGSCRSYSGVINIDGNGDIGGCLRQLPPHAAFGNVFSDQDCYNTEAMRRLRRRQLVGLAAHDHCAGCFGAYGAGELLQGCGDAS